MSRTSFLPNICIFTAQLIEKLFVQFIMKQIVFSFNCCTFSKSFVRPKLSPHCPPTMYKVCGLLPFERIYGRALTVLTHPPPYALLLPALRIYSSTSSALFFSLSIHISTNIFLFHGWVDESDFHVLRDLSIGGW